LPDPSVRRRERSPPTAQPPPSPRGRNSPDGMNVDIACYSAELTLVPDQLSSGVPVLASTPPSPLKSHVLPTTHMLFNPIQAVRSRSI